MNAIFLCLTTHTRNNMPIQMSHFNMEKHGGEYVRLHHNATDMPAGRIRLLAMIPDGRDYDHFKGIYEYGAKVAPSTITSDSTELIAECYYDDKGSCIHLVFLTNRGEKYCIDHESDLMTLAQTIFNHRLESEKIQPLKEGEYWKINIPISK